MDESDAGGLGLRERKRAATRATIERAAISLSMEHGYDNVTVDMICEASMVSQRTFFNYFGSKDGVMVGAAPVMPTDDQIDCFVNSSERGVLTDLVTLLWSVFGHDELDFDMLRARRQIIMQTPSLLNSEMARVSEREESYTRIVLDRFRAQGNPGTERELADQARMVVSLAAGVMRYLKHDWTVTSTEKSSRELLSNAIEVLGRLTEFELHRGRR